MTFDGKAFGAEIVLAVKAHVEASLAPILARLDVVEQRLVQPVADTAVDLDAIKDEMESLRKAISDIPEPKAPEIPDVAALVAEAVAAIPPPAPGKDAELEVIRLMVADAVAALPPAKDGKDADPDAVAAQVKEIVGATLAGWEKPKDGESVTVAELLPVIQEYVQSVVAAIPAPKDGCGIKELLIDRAGALVATMADGRVKNLGPVVGKDADMGAVQASIAEKIAAIPAPRDGADGFGFDDLDVIHDGARGFTFRFAKGERVKDFSFSLPVVIDCGVFKEGQVYQAGDGVTWGGSFWIAREMTTEKPDSGKGWRLAVKRGRDGKRAPEAAPRSKEPVRAGIPAKAD